MTTLQGKRPALDQELRQHTAKRSRNDNISFSELVRLIISNLFELPHFLSPAKFLYKASLTLLLQT